MYTERSEKYPGWVLWGIFIVAFLFRLKDFGFLIPYYIHPDERPLVEVSLNIIKYHDLNPHFFKYASFPYYWVAGLYYVLLGVLRPFLGGGLTFQEFINGLHLDSLNFLLFYLGRATSIGFGLGGIFLTYVMGRDIFKREVGLWAAFFLAISPIHVLFSHMFKGDISLLFWVLLSFYFSWKIINDNKMKYYLFAAVCAGLCLATKYNFIPLVTLAGAAMFKQGVRGLIRPRFIISLYFGALIFFLCCPYCFLDFVTLKEDLLTEMKEQKYTVLINTLGSGPLIFNRYIFQLLFVFPLHFGPFIYLAGLWGGIDYLKENRKRAMLFLSFPVTYFIFSGMVSRQVIAHYDMLYFPFLFLLAANLFYQMLAESRKGFKKIGQILLILTMVVSLSDLYLSFSHVYFNFYEGVGSWISSNIPRDKVVVNYSGINPAGRLNFLLPYHVRRIDSAKILEIKRLKPDYFVIEQGFFLVGRKKGRQLLDLIGSDFGKDYREIKNFSLPGWIENVIIRTKLGLNPIKVFVYQRKNE